ncbi:MAG: YbgA family protein, partial [Candidatus Krumholzibacteria bacterium]|nr:YbgA family protein [Candidatus Krumholzibacteria bacterium]
RENFIERIFTYDRWRNMESSGRTAGKLVEFHARHKLLILSHSGKTFKELGALTARSGKIPAGELYGQYIKTLMEGMKLAATVKKNADVLMHTVGHFRKVLSSDEKKELLEIIERYRAGLIPLAVPVTLLNHYARKYSPEHLPRQYYLDPHPHELMLRNHV